MQETEKERNDTVLDHVEHSRYKSNPTVAIIVLITCGICYLTPH